MLCKWQEKWWTSIVVWLSNDYKLKNKVGVLWLLEWWNFAKLYETKNPPRGEGKQTRKIKVSAKNPKTQGGMQKGKGKIYVQELLLVARNILEKERQKKFEK